MKHKVKSIKINMIMNALLTMSSFIFPLITFPYAARILLPDGTGKITFVGAVVTYFSMFAQLGIPTYGIKACAKVRDDKEKLSRLVHELLMINVVTCLLVYVVFIFAVFTIPRFKQELPLFVITGVMIGLNAIGVEWLYKALEQYTYITVRSVIFKFISLIAMFIFVRTREDYLAYGIITIFASSASNILNFVNIRKFIILRPLSGYNIKPHLRMIVVFFSMSIATTIYTNLDNVMLGFMTNDRMVGLYGAAVKIRNILISIVTSASTVLLPRTTYYIDKGMKDEFESVVKKTMHFILLIAIPLAIYFILFAKEGIFFVSGKEYEDAIIPMQIIMPTLIICGMTNVIGIQTMIPLGLEKQVLHSVIAGALTDLILNSVLIPRYGAIGAAVGTLVAEIVVWIWQICVIRWNKIKIYESVSWKSALLSVAVATICIIGIKYLVLSDFAKLLFSATIFFMLYGGLMLLNRNTLAIDVMRQIVKKIKRK